MQSESGWANVVLPLQHPLDGVGVWLHIMERITSRPPFIQTSPLQGEARLTLELAINGGALPVGWLVYGRRCVSDILQLSLMHP